MKHLFIINPRAHKIRGKVDITIAGIHTFFQGYPHMRYDIHVTRWEQDAVCVVRYHAVNSDELLRVHVMGGSGTFSEVVSSIVGLPNIQVAAYPFGNANTILQYFGANKIHLFSSIRSQVLSSTTPLDTLCSGYRTGVSHLLIGLEAIAGREGISRNDNGTWKNNYLSRFVAAARVVFSRSYNAQKYKIELDGQKLDGEYISMLIANGPCYEKNMSPAVDAHPNDGFFDIYLTKKVTRLAFLPVAKEYQAGHYSKFPNIVSHYRGSKVSISSDKAMSLLMDGRPFYEYSVEIKVMPYSVDFVLPGGIDIAALPRVYNKSGGNTNV